ncbi:hypothetical protein B0H19DRAFT_1069390 [Mycena capillaripes]|nr:hypothetical protein B0H19DRAFT_1069390 [Mycena capillaripes]
MGAVQQTVEDQMDENGIGDDAKGCKPILVLLVDMRASTERVRFGPQTCKREPQNSASPQPEKQTKKSQVKIASPTQNNRPLPPHPRNVVLGLQARLRAQRRDARAVVLRLMSIAVAGGSDGGGVALETEKEKAGERREKARRSRGTRWMEERCCAIPGATPPTKSSEMQKFMRLRYKRSSPVVCDALEKKKNLNQNTIFPQPEQTSRKIRSKFQRLLTGSRS